MFKPLSQFNAFFKLAIEKTLCGTDQLVGLHLQNKFNQAHWAETISVKDAELLELIRWYDKTGSPTSIDTIRNAKARLKMKGLIDFTNSGSTSVYRLVKLYDDTDPSATLRQPFGNPSSAGLVSYTAHAEDVKTDDYQCTGAEVNELDELMEYWERDLQGGRLAFEHLSERSLWLNQRGMDWVKEMMKEASDSNNNPHGLSFKFLKAIVSKKLKPKKTAESSKGGGKKKEVKDTLAKLDELDY